SRFDFGDDRPMRAPARLRERLNVRSRERFNVRSRERFNVRSRERSSIRSLVRWIVCACVVACVLGAGERSARACGGGGSYGGGGLAELAVAGAIVVGTVVVADTTLTVYDSVHASTNNPPTVGWARTERWMATTQVAIGGLTILGMAGDKYGLP